MFMPPKPALSLQVSLLVTRISPSKSVVVILDRLDALTGCAAFLRDDEAGLLGLLGSLMSTTWTPLYVQVAPPHAARNAVSPSAETPTSAIFSGSTFLSASLLTTSMLGVEDAGRCPSVVPCW